MVDNPRSEPPSTLAGDLSRESTVVSGAVSAGPKPKQLGRYLLLERLGVGGMAEVYLAEQAGAVGFQKKVVVKRILPHLAADAQFVQMFAREAKVAARVSHPNVVQIYELAEEVGELFIAMEHIDGLTLHRLAAAAWEQGRAVPVDVVIRTIADAAMGLNAAHSLRDEQGKPVNLVHRDVSPDNLMVSKDGVTKVLDFGIAKGDLGGPKTKTGNLRGKIPFMPPEQIRGEVLDGRADLYALGVSAYWMLTGERPFDRQSDWHTMQAILNDVPKKASTHNAAVPPGLDDILAKLLHKDRDQRPSSGKDVADILDDLASPSSHGGRKTTVQFLAQVLPSSNSRGNPVSEMKPTDPPRPPSQNQASQNQASQNQAAQNQAAHPQDPPANAPPNPSPNLSNVPAPASMGELPPQHQEPSSSPEIRSTVPFFNESPEPTSVISSEALPPTPPPVPPLSPSSAQPLAPLSRPGIPPEDRSVINPVTRPAAPNAISDILSPPQRTGIPVPLIAMGLFGLLAAAVVVVVVIVPKLTADAGPDGGVPVVASADAGAGAIIDAGVVVAALPPITIEARNAPSRVLWKVGKDVVGVGTGKLTIPAGTKALLAEDLRRDFVVEVPIKDGAADYGALPVGTVIIVRKTDRTTILLGDDDVTAQRKLKLVAGRHRFKVTNRDRVKETTVEVVAGKEHTLDASK